MQIRKSYLAKKPELNEWFEGISNFNFGQLKNLDWKSSDLKNFENITYAVSQDELLTPVYVSIHSTS